MARQAAAQRQTDIDGWRQRFADIGSVEVARRIANATDQTAMRGRDRMRDALRSTLGRTRGPGGLGGQRPVGDYTVNAIQYRPINFKADHLEGATAEVYVQAEQGRRGRDQSAFLGFLFGEEGKGSTRRPGDVGMVDDRILIPQAMNLVLTQKLDGMDPTDSGGRQRPGLINLLEARSKPHNASGTIPGDAAYGRPRTRSEAMALTARSRSSWDRLLSPEAATAHHANAFGEAALRRRLAGKEGMTGVGRRKLGKEFAETGGTWDVFKGPDKRSGLPTYKARPFKIRDPAGGTHTFTRSNGTQGKMPNMLSVAPEFGQVGRAAGPRSLTLARQEVKLQPVLLAPWREMAARAADEMLISLDAELARTLQRKAEGRTF